ncbi:probable indole-3-pyruvate monooxygenase YUCCA4 isoform X2 [Phalaenopsis equestris]|uniref:probable indole-3-pyruvate monooxygenase YUCCA4 isoform X2 n=1 Tax=Phalaenopsis equestris TaxID=78828 RepID=UPI0009E26CB7|nr:probable indole-3-pyruvate monooxygenase YUCCA4 isoform X2 [Phalaenopsis equestris]
MSSRDSNDVGAQFSDQKTPTILKLKLNEEAMKSSNSKRIWVPGPLIIGAGPSGLAIAACLKEKGVPSLILEKENCIASSWRMRTYERLKLHLPKHLCELPLMPFPSDFPVYPTKQQFISYLDSYIKQFSIRPFFGMEVWKAEYDKTIEFWRINAGDDWEFICRWLIVATGENATAKVPDIPGMAEFKGRILHTSSFKQGDDFNGERVLVIGCGNSGMEVCLDLCNNHARASMVVRDELHVLPREVLGISTFGLSMWLLRWLPMSAADCLLLLCARLFLGDTEKHGLRRPKIGPLKLKNSTGKTPVLDIGALSKIKSGQIKVVPGINKFFEKGVEFVDGKQEEFDAIIFATGYKSNEEEFFCKKNGIPRTQFPNSWRGKNGLYATGFTRRGLLGASMDAHRISEDIACQWNSKTKHLPMEL